MELFILKNENQVFEFIVFTAGKLEHSNRLMFFFMSVTSNAIFPIVIIIGVQFKQ